MAHSAGDDGVVMSGTTNPDGADGIATTGPSISKERGDGESEENSIWNEESPN